MSSEKDARAEHIDAADVHHDEVHAHQPPAAIVLQHDQVAEEIVGGDYEDLPKGYFLRPNFLGTFTVSLTPFTTGSTTTTFSNQHAHSDVLQRLHVLRR